MVGSSRPAPVTKGTATLGPRTRSPWMTQQPPTEEPQNDPAEEPQREPVSDPQVGQEPAPEPSPQDPVLDTGQEEVFSREEVELGRIEHGADAGGHPQPKSSPGNED